MGKNNTVLIVGAIVAGYMLAPKEVKDKLLGGDGGGSFSFNFSDMLSGLGGILGQSGGGGGGIIREWLVNPDVPPLPDWVKNPPDWTGLIPDIPEWLNNPPDWITNPPSITDIPIIPELPSLLNLPEIDDVKKAIFRTGGVAARQVGGSFLTGSGLATHAPVIGKPLSTIGKTVSKTTWKYVPQALEKIVPKLGDDLFSFAAKKGIRYIPEVSEELLVRVAPKLAPRLAIQGGKVASRAIPILGWGLLAVDLGADVARLFGADVTEWLGLSGLVSAFTGENPIEKWVDQRNAEQELSPYNPNISSERGTGYSFAPYLAGADPAGVIRHLDADTGQSEAPSLAYKAYDMPIDLAGEFKEWGTKNGAAVVSINPPESYPIEEWR